MKKELGQLERDKNMKAVPWRQILSSPAVIALIFAQVKFEFDVQNLAIIGIRLISWATTGDFLSW